MLKRILPALLALLLCAAIAAAETPATLVITDAMQFHSGPGTQYTQSAFHNTPPQPGESAQVLGRVTAEDGADWLLVCFTGHWFSTEAPVWYYLPVSAAPAHADAPMLTFSADPNAFTASSVRIYADPEGANYDGYLLPDDSDVTVLHMTDSMAYIEAVNPFGHPVRGFIRREDLALDPGTAAPEDAPEGTAVLLNSRSLPLTLSPASDQITVLPLKDGSLILRYDAFPDSGDPVVALAVISPEGTLIANPVHRVHDAQEESSVELLLPAQTGFRICRFEGSEAASVRETHYDLSGTKTRTEVRRFSPGDPRECLGTAGFVVSLGLSGEAGEAGGSLPLCASIPGGGSLLVNIGTEDSIPCAAECGGKLLLPVRRESDTRLLVIGSDAALLADLALPLSVSELQAVPLPGGCALLTHDGCGLWQGWMLDAESGSLTAIGPSVGLPVNRSAALLSADGDWLLMTVGGTQTQFLLAGNASQQLAAQTPGMLLHAASDGETAALLLMQDGQLRLETWALRLP